MESWLVPLIFMLWPQQTEQMQVTCTPDESQLFWLGEKPEYPQFGCRWCLISPVYIYGRPQVLAYAKKNNNNNNNNCLVVLQVFKKERVGRSFFFFHIYFGDFEAQKIPVKWSQSQVFLMVKWFITHQSTCWEHFLKNNNFEVSLMLWNFEEKQLLICRFTGDQHILC